MRVVGPHHDRARAQSRCVTVSTSPAFMNAVCDRASTFPRVPHPEKSKGCDAKRGHLVHYEGASVCVPFSTSLLCLYILYATGERSPSCRRLSALIISPIQ